MAQSAKSASRTIVLDTSSAQFAIDKLSTSIDKYNATLSKTTLTDKQRIDTEKQLQTAIEKRAAIQQQIENGLGSTVNQQIKYVQELTKQMKQLAVGTQEFADKRAQIAQANEVLAQMQGRVKSVDDAQKQISSGNGLFSAVFLANVGTRLIGFLKGVAQESIQIALQAVGVQRAFERLNNPKLLDNLRQATKGTVSDLELMKRAVQANNFQIPLESLGTLLQFAQQRARDTGESVDYLVESIVTGIARKSPLILDNLGINIQRIQKEFEKTGDFAQAAFNVVNDELSKAGPSIDSAADKVDRLKAKWENFKVSVGSGIVSVADAVSDSFSSLSAAFGDENDARQRMNIRTNQIIAEANEKARDEELGRIQQYTDQLSKTDLKGRDAIVEQVKVEMEKLFTQESNAYVSGSKNLASTLSYRLDLWRDFYKKLVVEQNANKGDTISGIESEMSILQSSLKSLKIGSDQFISTRQRIADLQKQLDDATGKTAQEAEQKAKQAAEKIKALHDQYLDLINSLNNSITDAKVPQAAKPVVDAIQKAQDELRKLDEIKAKGAISDAEYAIAKKKIDDEELARIKQITEQEQARLDANKVKLNQADNLSNIGLSGALKDAFESFSKEPVPVDVMPVLPEENLQEGMKKIKAAIDKFQRDEKAGVQLDVLKAGNDLEKRRDAVIAELEFEKDAALNNADLTANERSLIEAQYREKEKQAWEDYYNEMEAKLLAVVGFVQQALGIFDTFNQATNNRENAQLQQELKLNDKKKAAYKSQLDSKLISQVEYNQKVAELDADAENKKQALAKKQFERNKKVQIAQTIINAAGAGIRLWYDPGFPLVIPLGILLAAETAAKIAAISSQNPTFAKGGVPEGPRHGGKYGESGIALVRRDSGQEVGEMEGGEPILSRDTYRNNKTIVDALLHSSIYKRGSTIKPFWQARPYQVLNVGGIVGTMQKLRFANGGIAPDGNNFGNNNNASSEALLSSLQQSQSINIMLTETIATLREQLKIPVSAIITQKQLDDSKAQQSRILNDAIFK